MKVIELKLLGNDPVKLKERFDKKEITNEEFNKLAQDILVNYKDLLLSAVNNPVNNAQGQATMTVTEMRSSLRVADKVEACKEGDKLYLEDADYQFLKTRVDAMTWRFASHNIVRFVDDVDNAPEAEMPKA